MKGKSTSRAWWLSLLAALAIGLNPSSARARVIDNFNAAQRASWEDANPANLPLKGGQQADGKFTFSVPALGQPYFVSSKKTSETFELKEGRTIEFRVDLLNGQGPDSFAILGFIPQATGPNTLAGYGLAKSESDILITKGINKYFFNENVNPAVKNNNVTLVLNLAVRAGNVYITGQVLDKDDGNRVIWEKSFIDTPAADVMGDGKDEPPAPFTNLAGNFVLYLYADGGKDPTGYQVVYDNAEAFVTETTVVDNFNTAPRQDWEDANPANLPLKGGQIVDGKFQFAVPALGQAYFVTSKKTSKTYELTEGTRHEFSVDLVHGQGPDSFAILAWIPTATGPNTLAGYGLAKSETDVLITKGINKYFFNENPNPPLKNENVRLTLTLTVQNGNVTVRGRVFDKSDNDRVIFDKTYLDTPAAEVLADGKDEPPAPFVTSGNIVLYLYADGGKDANGYQVVYDDLTASVPPAAANEAPIVSEVTPGTGANYVAATDKLSFKIVDDKNIPDAGVVVTLNGVRYTTANGLTLSAAGTSRTASLGGFESNKDYSGDITITDSEGLARSTPLSFDTFTTAVRLVEIEDYNFNGGSFINSPTRGAEGGSANNAYNDLVGTPGADFNETRTAPRAQDSIYRTQDAIRMAHSLDRRRALYDNDQGVYDYDVGDLATGEWMNYTRDFAAGTYEIYLREAVVNLAQAESVLEKVTTAANVADQKTEVIGSFLAKTTGFTFRNIPLTDGAGVNRLKIRLSGVTTLRLRTVTADTDTGNRLLNYLAFVPVADAGVQRASIAALTPAAGASVDTVTPVIEVAIQNRDTTVNASTIKLTLNGVDVTGAKVSTTASGATLSYTLAKLPASGVLNKASISFKDNEGVEVKTEWQFAVVYRALDPASKLNAKGKTSGFKLHVVQASIDGGSLENSLDRAESQLASGSSIPRVVDTNAVVNTINFDKRAGEVRGYFPDDVMVPGIDPDVTGNGDNDFTVEIVTYLDLPAGVHRFGVICDDGYKVASGIAPINASTTPLAFHNGGPADETFDFVVSDAGIYPFRMVWYERAGAGHAEWFSVNPTTGERTLLNDAAAAGSIKAWSAVDIVAPSITLESAAKVNGPYTPVTATLNLASKTATLPLTGESQFFRLKGASPLKFKGTAIQGANVVLSWQ